MMDGTLGLQIMYAAAVLGAGVVGVVTLFLPEQAARHVFAGEASVDPYMRILGALWLALGLVGVLGLIQPEAFVPLLLIQLIYKTVWLGVVGLPEVLRGNRGAGLLVFTGLFAAWVAALLILVPFRESLGLV